jgi:hypothetical protein
MILRPPCPCCEFGQEPRLTTGRCKAAIWAPDSGCMRYLAGSLGPIGTGGGGDYFIGSHFAASRCNGFLKVTRQFTPHRLNSHACHRVRLRSWMAIAPRKYRMDGSCSVAKQTDELDSYRDLSIACQWSGANRWVGFEERSQPAAI